MFKFLFPCILLCLIYLQGQDNANELTPTSQLGLEGKKCFLIAFNSRAKVASVTIHKTGPNAMVHCVPIGKGYYIVNPIEILDPLFENIALPHPSSALCNLADDLLSFIPCNKDDIELCNQWLYCVTSDFSDVVSTENS